MAKQGFTISTSALLWFDIILWSTVLAIVILNNFKEIWIKIFDGITATLIDTLVIITFMLIVCGILVLKKRK